MTGTMVFRLRTLPVARDRVLRLAQLLGCVWATATCHRSEDDAEQPGPSASASSNSAGVTASSPPVSSMAVPSAPGPRFEHQRGQWQAKVVDLAQWMADHDVRIGQVRPPCWELSAGAPPRPALICHRSGRDRLTATIHVAVQHRLAKAWEGIVFTYANWLFTTLEIKDDGAVLVVADPRPRACNRSAAALASKMYPGLGADQLLSNIRTACTQRGTYRWNGQRYVQNKTPQRPLPRPW